jgi:ectoine hydroxylase-related dioxygenase (phytanoyl-CoA dioxygenase family)
MLQETDEENGALFVIPESHDEGKHIRENMLEHKATFNKGFSHRFVDYDESFQSRYTEEDKVFINATPGDLLVLNTDAWHGGGVLKSEERDRMAIYYHNRQ